MTRHTVNGVVLLFGILLAPAVGAQDGPDSSPRSTDDVIVRPVGDVGTIERLTIALTRAFIPGSKVFSPLYAYGREPACSETGNSKQAVLKLRGPAALVYDDEGVTRARYHQTTALAIKDAQESGWCSDDSVTRWSLATTYPLEGDEIKEEQRYLSREVELVDLQLHAGRD